MTQRFRMLTLVALAVAALISGCTAGHPHDVVLDGRPRLPDDEGVATTITRSRVVLDGKRSYGVSRRLKSFSTYTLALQPVVDREGQYVQVGVSGQQVVWLAGIAAVVPTNPPVVIYTGRLVRVDRDRLIFRDGTTFRLGRGVARPRPKHDIRVDIDPAAHVVRATHLLA